MIIATFLNSGKIGENFFDLSGNWLQVKRLHLNMIFWNKSDFTIIEVDSFFGVANKGGGVRSNKGFLIANTDNKRRPGTSDHKMFRIKYTKNRNAESTFN